MQMLLSVKIHRFRTCRDMSLKQFNLPMVLLGRNGAGKTNILQAIAWAASMTQPQDLRLLREAGHVELVFRLNGVEYTFSVQRQRSPARSDTPVHVEESLYRRVGRGERTAVFERKDTALNIAGVTPNATISLEMPSLALLSALGGPNSPLPEIEWVIGFLQGFKYYPLLNLVTSATQPMSGVYVGNSYDEWRKRPVRTIASEQDLNLSLIEAKLENPDKFEEILALLDRRGLGVLNGISIVNVPGAEKPARGRILGIFYSPPGTKSNQSGIDFWQLSMGTQRIVQLITQIVLDRITVALIEQPEDGIHPALLRKLIDILHTYSSEFQVVMTSHSPDVFNSVQPRQVRLVTLQGAQSKAVPLTSAEIELAHRYMEEQGTFAKFLESM